MLDIDKIFADFQHILNEFDEAKLDSWIAFDEERLQISKLLAGETVPILLNVPSLPRPNIINNSEYSDIVAGNNAYLKAA